MLLVTAFRGPVEFLPFEPGARWTLEHVIQVYTDPTLYERIIPDTLVFVAGSVALSFTIGFGLAWLVERTDLPGREVWFTLILFPFLVPTIVLGIAWIFLMGPKAGWLNLALRALLGERGGGAAQRLQHGRPDRLPGARLRAVRVHPADRGAAHYEPGAGGGERRVRRLAHDHLPARDHAGAAAGMSWRR